MFEGVKDTIAKAKKLVVPNDRKIVLESLIVYLKSQIEQGKVPTANFVCTHNSRRSQMSQIWAKTMADYYNVEIECHSGGVEVTAFNERAVRALKQQGFAIEKASTMVSSDNPTYQVYHGGDYKAIRAYSKLVTDESAPQSNFAAVMTCAHADENCPVIFGADIRIPIRYEDPKVFDGTSEEEEQYAKRSLQIASEMCFVFSTIAT